MAFCDYACVGFARAYVDDGYSGKDLNRPGIQQLIADAQTRAFDIVLVYKLDRLSRRQKDVLYLLEDVFQPNGIGFRSATESFDTTNAFGKTALGMMAVFAQLERETTIERVRLGKKQAAREGRWKGGPVTFGYRYDPSSKRLDISEPEAETVRRIFEWYAEGLSQAAIAERLNNEGVPAPRGAKRWHQSTVRYVLKNAAYTGRTKHKHDLYEGGYPAIIPHSLWARVQEQLRTRQSKHWRMPYMSGLASGIIWCAECGARMWTKRQWINWPENPKLTKHCYLCYSYDGRCAYMIKDPNCPNRHYWPVEEIDAKIEQALFQYSLDEKMIREVVEDELARFQADLDASEVALHRLQDELAEVNRRLERWYDAFERGMLRPEELEHRIRRLQEQKQQLEARIAEQQQIVKEQDRRRISAEEVIREVKNFPALWPYATFSERQMILRNLVNRVLVDREGRVKLEFLKP